MGLSLSSFLTGAVLLFGAFSSSPSYKLQSYGVGAAASNSAASATYRLQTNTGEIQSVPTSSPSYSAKSGQIQAEQANVPPAPSLSNGSGTYYNKLDMIINNGGNPSDATFSVAVSTDNFVTEQYVQIDGSLDTVPMFQTYTQWGGGSGSTIIGLTSGTTYQVKVSAMHGQFTHSAYGPSASAATASPSLSFSVSPNSFSLPNLLSGTVVTSSDININFETNANYGGNVYVYDSSGGLVSASHGTSIASTTGDLGALAHGYGLQGTAVGQTSGGPLSIFSPYSGSSANVGAVSTTPQVIFGSTSPLVGGAATAVVKAKASSTDPSAGDYKDTLTFIAAASF